MISMEKRASAHLPAAGVWLQRGEGLAQVLRGAARGLTHWLQRRASAFARAQARRTAMRELYSLDDRLLQDIGLSRDLVAPTVNAMFRANPAGEAAQVSRPVDTGAGVEVAPVDASNDGRYKTAA
jgi:uncharacterized protein YjiS (DUF1127 family)